MISLSNPMEQFELISLIPLRGGNVDISFTNSALMMFLSVLRFRIIDSINNRKWRWYYYT